MSVHEFEGPYHAFRVAFVDADDTGNRAEIAVTAETGERAVDIARPYARRQHGLSIPTVVGLERLHVVDAVEVPEHLKKRGRR